MSDSAAFAAQRPRRKRPLTDSQRWTAEEGSRSIVISDLQKLALLALLAPAALLPRAVAPRYAAALTRAFTWLMPGRTAKRVAAVPPGVLQVSGDSPADFARSQDAAQLQTLIEVISTNLGRRSPEVILSGMENVRPRPGQGVIFWIERSPSSSLMTKAALSASGFRLAHLSRPSHGLSNTRFGIRFLNSLMRRAEAGFISKRVIIQNNSAGAALRQLRSILLSGGAVTITVGDMAERLVEARCLAGWLRVSTGPAHLARSTGAMLVPVFSWRRADGAYAVHLDCQLDLGAEGPRSFTAVAAEYAKRLEAFVRDHPRDWTGWQLGNYVER